MSPPHVPFAWVGGKPHLIVNYELEPTGDLPPLHDLLDGLLACHDEHDILLLRPLGPAEAQLRRSSTGDAEIEAWAQMVVRPEDRCRPRPALSGASPRERRRRGRNSAPRRP